MATQTTYLIIGNGIAGITAAEILRAEDPEAMTMIVADDPRPTYYRPALKDYLAGRIVEEKLWSRPSTFYREQQIRFVNDRLTSLSPTIHQATFQSGKQIKYGKLLLAHGARAARLTCPGADLRGVYTLRSIDDYQALLKALPKAARVVICGSGTLALETAETFRHRGLHVIHLVRRQTLWSEVLDSTASDLVLQQEKRSGVEVHLETEIVEIIGQQGHVTAVKTNQGKRLNCDLVIVAIGIEPNIAEARAAGIICQRGIIVDHMMHTNQPDIYAAGDILETRFPASGRTRVIGQWYPAVQQARAAAYSMLGLLDQQQQFQSNTFYNATQLYGLDFASVGQTTLSASMAGYQEIVADPEPRSYRKVVLKNGIPIGIMMLGSRLHALAFKRAIDHRVSLIPVLERLFKDDFNLTDWLNQQGVPAPVLGVRRLDNTGSQRKTEPRKDVVVVPSMQQALQEVQSVQDEPLLLTPGEKGEEDEMPADARKSQGEAILVHFVDPELDLHLPEVLLSRDQSMFIGRQAGVHVVIEEGTVSRRHAELFYSNGHYLLRDLGSTNGTYVNDERLAPNTPYLLENNDRIRFGDIVTFRFLQRMTVPVPAKVAPPPEKSVPPPVVPSRRPTTVLTRKPEEEFLIEEAPRSARQQPQPVLNPDGTLQPPGSLTPVPASVVETFKELPALIVLPDNITNASDAIPQVHLLRPGKRTMIGREKSNDITLNDPVVSRRHAEVYAAADGVYIHDVGSSNGVLINQARIAKPHRLKHGDRIKLGDTLIFFVDLQAGQEQTSSLPMLPRLNQSNSKPSAQPVRQQPQPGPPVQPREVPGAVDAAIQRAPVDAREMRQEPGWQPPRNPAPYPDPFQRQEPTYSRRNAEEAARSSQNRPQPASANQADVTICPICGIPNMKVARFCAGCSAPLHIP